MPKKLDCRLKINKSKKSCVNKTKSSKKENCPKGSRRNSKTGRCVKSKSVKSRKSAKSRKSVKSKKSTKPVKSKKSTKPVKLAKSVKSNKSAKKFYGPTQQQINQAKKKRDEKKKKHKEYLIKTYGTDKGRYQLIADEFKFIPFKSK